MEETNSKAKSVASKSWTHNRTTETDTRRAELKVQGGVVGRAPCPYCKSWINTPDYSKGRTNRTPNQDTPKSPNIRRCLNVKSADSSAQAPHLKYGMFGIKKSATNPKAKDAEKPKSPMKQRFREKIENDEVEEIKIGSEPSSPLFSVRALNDQEKNKFSVSHSNCGDVDAMRLVSTASP